MYSEGEKMFHRNYFFFYVLDATDTNLGFLKYLAFILDRRRIMEKKGVVLKSIIQRIEKEVCMGSTRFGKSVLTKVKTTNIKGCLEISCITYNKELKIIKKIRMRF